MGIYESNTVIFHGVSAESRAKIHSFLQGYLDLFKKHFGEDQNEGNVYIGGIPICEFDLDRDSDSFPREEGYYVMGISPRWAKAWYWENAPGFFGIFLEQELCTKITWYQYWDQGEPNRIYMNDSTEAVPSSWKHYEFVPGENGVPAEYDEENEDDDGEAFNQYVDEVMKGEREVEWKDGFPDYWQDKYDELLSQRLNERMEEMDFDFDDDDDDGEEEEEEEEEWEKSDSGRESGLDTLVAQNEQSMRHMRHLLQMKQDQAQDRLKARQQKFDRSMGSKINIVSGTVSSKKPSNIPSERSIANETKDRICPGCHCPVADGMHFCENCGHRI